MGGAIKFYDLYFINLQYNTNAQDTDFKSHSLGMYPYLILGLLLKFHFHTEMI